MRKPEYTPHNVDNRTEEEKLRTREAQRQRLLQGIVKVLRSTLELPPGSVVPYLGSYVCTLRDMARKCKTLLGKDAWREGRPGDYIAMMIRVALQHKRFDVHQGELREWLYSNRYSEEGPIRNTMLGQVEIPTYDEKGRPNDGSYD